MKRSILAPFAGLAVGLILVGCGNAAPGSAAPASAPAASVAVSAAPSVAASAEASAGSGAAASFPSASDLAGLMHQAPDLEAKLPTSIGGQALQVLSVRGNSALLGDTGPSSQITAALGAMGKKPEDLTFALAAGGDVTVGVYQISGISGNLVLAGMSQAMGAGASGVTVTDSNKGGKTVKQVASPSFPTPIYFYANGDYLYFVGGSDDAKVTEVLSKLS